MNCCLEAFDFKYEGGQHAPPTEDIHVEQSDSIHEAAENHRVITLRAAVKYRRTLGWVTLSR